MNVLSAWSWEDSYCRVGLAIACSMEDKSYKRRLKRGAATGSGSQTRTRVEQNMVISLWTEINNTLWLVFHLSFMYSNQYSPKSYTYVLKCLQESQISPLQLQVPCTACFPLKKKKRRKRKKYILSQSLGHLMLQKIIREVWLMKIKISPSQKPALFSSLCWGSHLEKCHGKNGVAKDSAEAQVFAKCKGWARRTSKRNAEVLRRPKTNNFLNPANVQKNRIAWVGKDLWSLSSPNPLQWERT